MSTIDSIIGLYCRTNKIPWAEQQLLKRVYKKCSSPGAEFPRTPVKRIMDYLALSLAGGKEERNLYKKLENNSEYRERVQSLVQDINSYTKNPSDLLYEQHS